ncbi:DNA-directed DNA polymerase [Thermocrinis albus DSM 14484]|uniref:DNA-directed DNA polymerase n=1 Tax=Thermocrinis albus (strain DSM 14484 / JCM 11386 / HI 11/12) TaxID=638303 RepID=D3SQI5_THEAH|nr:DNA polymerase III subunit delta' [Thermocrinis albus]ADC89422.1 DNA-directed DNA polymerase [Thermocrinis albus DSM 14484]
MREKLRSFLEKMYKRGRVPSAIIFYGKEGVGKAYMAFELAKALLCLRRSYPPCGECASCHLMDDFLKKDDESKKVYGESDSGKKVYLYLQGDHPDFVYLKPEKAEIKVDQIRGVKDFTLLTPAMSRKKVVLVKPAEAMNVYAQNAFLKLLEEPPADTHFLLVTHNLQNILPTVKSRCFLLEVPPYTQEELATLSGIKDPLLLSLADGSLGYLNYLKERPEILQMAQKILSGNFMEIYQVAQEIEEMELQDKVSLLRILEALIHTKSVEEKTTRYKNLMDTIALVAQNLSKGLNLQVFLFYVALRIDIQRGQEYTNTYEIS